MINLMMQITGHQRNQRTKPILKTRKNPEKIKNLITTMKQILKRMMKAKAQLTM